MFSLYFFTVLKSFIVFVFLLKLTFLYRPLFSVILLILHKENNPFS